MISTTSTRWVAPVEGRDPDSRDYPPADWQRTNWLGAAYLLNGKRQFHTGDDLNKPGPADIGEPVRAITDGEVVFAGRGGGTWGYLVIIRHTHDGTFTPARYAHLAGLTVRKGEQVQAGHVIGFVADPRSFAAFEAHLHFDLGKTGDNWLLQRPMDWPGLDSARIYAHYQDPAAFLRARLNPLPRPDPSGEWYSVSAPEGVRVRSLPAGAPVGVLPFGTRLRVDGSIAAKLGSVRYTWGQITDVDSTWDGLRGGWVARSLLKPLERVAYRLGVNVDPRNPMLPALPDLEALKPLSALRVRYRLSMGDGSTNWHAADSVYNPLFADCEAAGVDYLVIATHELWGEAQGYHWPSMNILQWMEFGKRWTPYVAQLACRIGKRGLLQLWNEPDQASHAAVGMPSEALAALIEMAVPAVREVNPALRIIGPGLVSGKAQYWEDTLLLSPQARRLDGMSLHAYKVYGTKPSAWFPTREQRSLANVLRDYDFGQNVYISEIGVCGAGGRLNAAQVGAYWRDFRAEAARFARIKTICWFALYHGQDNCFGLLQPGGEKVRDMWV